MWRVADFAPAHKRTMGHEGWPGYVFHGGDKGGETLGGIARRSNRDWPGWKIVDEKLRKILNRVGVRPKGNPRVWKIVNDAILSDHVLNATLYQMAERFYKERYWDVLELDAEPDQHIAEYAYDKAVNMGIGPGKMILAVMRQAAKEAG